MLPWVVECQNTLDLHQRVGKRHVLHHFGRMASKSQIWSHLLQVVVVRAQKDQSMDFSFYQPSASFPVAQGCGPMHHSPYQIFG